MTDKELIEFAAKAAGISKQWDGSLVDRNHPNRVWNPLTDDGDALRLAVKLRIGIGDRVTTVTTFHKQGMSKGSVYVEEHDMRDPCAATRRAITRAAAQIGKEMK